MAPQLGEDVVLQEGDDSQEQIQVRLLVRIQALHEELSRVKGHIHGGGQLGCTYTQPLTERKPIVAAPHTARTNSCQCLTSQLQRAQVPEQRGTSEGVGRLVHSLLPLPVRTSFRVVQWLRLGQACQSRRWC